MTLSEELQWRGFVNQTTYEDIKILDGESISFYWGVDPSADSMHIGQLAMAIMIRHFISHGHKATLLVGGATGMVGDPDGKASERTLKSEDEVAQNKAGIRAQYNSLFDGQSIDIVDNYEWFKDMNLLDFLREVGKNVPLSQMLGRDFIQSRLGEGGSGISYAEFSYSLIQGYDFLHLYRQKGVTLQIAGADQWGNSISGVQLLRRIENVEGHVWTAPLILNKSTGKKFGKSEEGAVWLAADKTSVYKFYQFWLNVDDQGVLDYLKLYTLLTPEDIERIQVTHAQNPADRTAQKTLAYEVTALVHGVERAQGAEAVTSVLFGAATLNELSSDDIAMLAEEIPALGRPSNVGEALIAAGYAASNGEARRLIAGGAVSVGGIKLTEDTIFTEPTLIKKGKNSFVLVR